MNLDELIDIVEPPPVPWTPQTVGWAILGTVLVLAAALALRGWLRRRAANRYRREATAELDALERPTVAAVNAILKRAAMVAYSRDQVAALAGAQWVSFLTSAGGRPLDAAQAALLADGGYSLRNSEGEELRVFARDWVRGHRADWQQEASDA